MEHVFYYDTPIGRIGLSAAGDCITGVFFGGADFAAPLGARCEQTPPIRRAYEQLQEYFQGIRTEFDVPLALRGTDFQTSVWKALSGIPYGQTRTYAQIAAQIGRPKACRAVGAANHRNPLAIFVPCHRVVGASGALTGYAGGLAAKRYLLELEARFRP